METTGCKLCDSLPEAERNRLDSHARAVLQARDRAAAFLAAYYREEADPEGLDEPADGYGELTDHVEDAA